MSVCRRITLYILFILLVQVCVSCEGRVSYEPPVLPVSFLVNESGDISIVGEASMVTFLGEISIGSKFNLKEQKRGLLVVFKDEKAKGGGRKEYYLVNTGDREIVAVVDGKTRIEAQERRIKIDITNSKLRKITFKNEKLQKENNISVEDKKQLDRGGFFDIGGSNVFPDDEDIPDYMYLESRSRLTNEDISEQFENTTRTYSLIESFGRKSGEIKVYESECIKEAKFSSITVNVAYMKTNKGALKYYNWIQENMSPQKRGPFKEIRSIGGESSVFSIKGSTHCSRSQNCAGIYFVRNNVFTQIFVCGDAIKFDDEKVLQKVKQIAGIVDLKIFIKSE